MCVINLFIYFVLFLLGCIYTDSILLMEINIMFFRWIYLREFVIYDVTAVTLIQN